MKQNIHKGNGVEMEFLEWILIQYECYLFKREKFGHAQRENVMQR